MIQTSAFMLIVHCCVIEETMPHLSCRRLFSEEAAKKLYRFICILHKSLDNKSDVGKYKYKIKEFEQVKVSGIS